MRSGKLSGNVAIVTGAGRGMGRAFAKIMAENDAIVIVNDVNEEEAEKVAREIGDMGGEALAVKADVSSFRDVSEMVDVVLKLFGRIDILVNNAGILYSTMIEDIGEEEWDRVIDINLKGVFNCSKAVLKVMKEQRRGKIVNVSSTAGKTTSTYGGAHYTASKAGVLGFTRHMAREVGSYNINVNAICPGIIDTEMIRRLSTPERLKKIREKLPLGRIGTTEEAANLVLFLVSDDSSFITGAAIDIDAGELVL